MKFVRLYIENFKCFREFDLLFNPGLNLIYGPNESGKTTLFQALVLSLFGPHSTREKHFGDLDRDDFVTLGSNRKPVLKVTYETGKESVTVVRDFSESKVLIGSGDNQKSFDRMGIKSAKEHISESLGGIEEEMFTKYASITHVELARLDSASYQKENEDMEESLLKIIESRHGVGLLDVGRRIEKDLKTNRKTRQEIETNLDDIKLELDESTRIEGNLTKLKKEFQTADNKLIKKKARFNDLETIMKSVSMRRKKQEEIKLRKANIEILTKEVNLCQKAVDEKKDLMNMIEKYPVAVRNNHSEFFHKMKEIRSIEDKLGGKSESVHERYELLSAKLRNDEKELERRHSYIMDGSKDVQEFKTCDNEKVAIERQLLEVGIRLEALENQKADAEQRKKFFNNLIIGCIFVGIAILVIANLFGLPAPYSLIIAILFTTVFGTTFWLLSRKAVSQDLLSDIEKISEEQSELLKRHADLESVMTQLSSKLGLESRDELDRKYDEYRRDEIKLDGLRKQVGELESEEQQITKDKVKLEHSRNEILHETGYKTIPDLVEAIEGFDEGSRAIREITRRIQEESIEERLRTAKTDLSTETMWLDEMEKNFNEDFSSEHLAEDELILLEKELNDLEIYVPEIQKSKTSIEAQIKMFEGQVQDGAEVVEEQLDRYKNTLQDLYNEKEEFEYLQVILSQMEETYKSTFLPDLESRSVSLFKEFAEASDKTFTLKDWPSINISSTKLDGFSERHLSQGTRDQLYFSLRISWNDILSPKGLKLPLIWDDPFVYWDESRTKGVCEIGRKLVETGHQLIVFTHREELVEMFKNSFGENMKFTALNK